MAQDVLDPSSIEYVVPSDVPVNLVFFVPITTGSTYNGTHKLVKRDNSLPGGPAGRYRTTRWSGVLLSLRLRLKGG